MQPIPILPIILSLLTLATAQDYCYGNPSDEGYCDIESWTNTTTSSSPSVDDCQDSCRNILSDAGDWGVNLNGAPEGERRNMYLGPCSIGVGRGPNQSDPLTFSMANQDLVDLAEGVINRFQTDSRVSGEGNMWCQGKHVHFWVG